MIRAWFVRYQEGKLGLLLMQRIGEGRRGVQKGKGALSRDQTMDQHLCRR